MKLRELKWAVNRCIDALDDLDVVVYFREPGPVGKDETVEIRYLAINAAEQWGPHDEFPTAGAFMLAAKVAGSFTETHTKPEPARRLLFLVPPPKGE